MFRFPFLSSFGLSERRHLRNRYCARRHPHFERLEDRCYLDGTPLDPIEIPPAENPPELPTVDLSGLLNPLEGDFPTLVDEGDYYWHFDEQIPLHRIVNEFLIHILSTADGEEIISALTDEAAPLEGFQASTVSSDLSIWFRPGQEIPVQEPDLGEIVSFVDGIEWGTPIFMAGDDGTRVFLNDQLAVALAPGVDPNEFFATGFSSWERFFDNQYIATVSEGGAVGALELANELSSDPNVEWAAPNFYTDFQVEAIPNDPVFGNQWGFNNTGQTGARNDADSDLVEAWDSTTGATGIVVAVLDNGVQLNHPDLSIFTNSGEIPGNGIDDDNNGFIDDVSGWDFAGAFGVNVPENNPSPETQHDNHGTAVAGIVGALGNNGVGVSGAAQNVRILPIKIARDDNNTGGGFVAPELIARAVYYAAGIIVDASGVPTGVTWDAADILVNSWGGGAANPILTAAFNYIQTHGRSGNGVASFNAAGNSAGGTVAALTYQVINVPVTAGQKQYIWSFQTNNDAFIAGENRSWIADITLPNGVHELLDNDNNLAAWASNGNQLWTIVDDPTHAYGTARFVAQAGALTQPNQQTNLISPVINVAAPGTLSFARYVSSQLQFDQFGNPIADPLVVYEITGGGMPVPIFADAGNPFPNRPVQYPANLASTIAVGASTDWDFRSAYSQFGTALDIAAPSNGGYASITTTDRAGADGYDVASDYTSTFGGTSAATPLAAGIGALLLSRNSDLTAADIRAVLRNTTDKIGGNNGLAAYDMTGFNQFYGFGRVNANTAVDAVPVASGDYNGNGAVDAADYTVWRDRLGGTVMTRYTSADGNGDGQITQADYDVWKAHFGQTITPTPGSGSISSASESAAASDIVQQAAGSQTPAESSEKAASVAAELKNAHSDSLAAISAPLNAPIINTFGFGSVRQAGVNRDVSLNTSVCQDAGLLAWLSSHSMTRFDDSLEQEEGKPDLSTGGTDLHRDAIDGVLENLDASLVRGGAKSLVRHG